MAAICLVNRSQSCSAAFRSSSACTQSLRRYINMSLGISRGTRWTVHAEARSTLGANGARQFQECRALRSRGDVCVRCDREGVVDGRQLTSDSAARFGWWLPRSLLGTPFFFLLILKRRHPLAQRIEQSSFAPRAAQPHMWRGVTEPNNPHAPSDITVAADAVMQINVVDQRADCDSRRELVEQPH